MFLTAHKPREKAIYLQLLRLILVIKADAMPALHDKLSVFSQSSLMTYILCANNIATVERH